MDSRLHTHNAPRGALLNEGHKVVWVPGQKSFKVPDGGISKVATVHVTRKLRFSP
jgi:hypothetical protein